MLALADEELHGYAIMQALSEVTEGREAILPGTLYAALARMVDEGLVEVREGPGRRPSGGPRRRCYRRTTFGRAVARAESERLRALLAVARAQKIFRGRTVSIALQLTTILYALSLRAFPQAHRASSRVEMMDVFEHEVADRRRISRALVSGPLRVRRVPQLDQRGFR